MQKKHSQLSNKLTLEELRETLRIPEYNVDQLDFSDVYHYTYNDALKEGKSEEEAEEIALQAEGDAMSEDYIKHRDAVISVADTYFGYHDLVLTPLKKDPQTYLVTPKKDWRESATCILQTINGVGQFEFKNLNEFLKSGPYTARYATISHLHWLHWWGEVYGDASPKNLYYRHLK